MCRPFLSRPLRQNDFGGTLGRARSSKTKLSSSFLTKDCACDSRKPHSGDFFTASARAAVAPVYQPIVNALPLPDPNAPLIDPSCDNITNPCLANLTVAYSNPSSLNATSIRIDHNLTGKITLFARYNHAPSHDAYRYWEELAYNNANTEHCDRGRHHLAGSHQGERLPRELESKHGRLSLPHSPTFMAQWRRPPQFCSRPRPPLDLIKVRPSSVFPLATPGMDVRAGSHL